MTTDRYAIYAVPAAGSPLYRFGASVLGYDGYDGTAVPYLAGVDAGWPAKVAAARTYGFHGTLKAPFRLAESATPDALVAAVDAIAAARPAVAVGPLRVAAIGSFIALVPTAPCPALDALAAACVRELDALRAPLNSSELARRLRTPLDERQRAALDRWGYPYVLEDFRFHMTLTGALGERERSAALALLRDAFAVHPAAQLLTIDRLTIARQIDDAPFQVFHAAPLAPSPGQ